MRQDIRAVRPRRRRPCPVSAASCGGVERQTKAKDRGRPGRKSVGPTAARDSCPRRYAAVTRTRKLRRRPDGFARHRASLAAASVVGMHSGSIVAGVFSSRVSLAFVQGVRRCASRPRHPAAARGAAPRGRRLRLSLRSGAAHFAAALGARRFVGLRSRPAPLSRGAGPGALPPRASRVLLQPRSRIRDQDASPAPRRASLLLGLRRGMPDAAASVRPLSRALVAASRASRRPRRSTRRLRRTPSRHPASLSAPLVSPPSWRRDQGRALRPPLLPSGRRPALSAREARPDQSSRHKSPIPHNRHAQRGARRISRPRQIDIAPRPCCPGELENPAHCRRSHPALTRFSLSEFSGERDTRPKEFPPFLTISPRRR